MTTGEGRQTIIDTAIAHDGRIDVLVNNAGITAMAPLLDYTVAQWRAVFHTHVEAMFLLSQEFTVDGGWSIR